MQFGTLIVVVELHDFEAAMFQNARSTLEKKIDQAVAY